MKIITPFILLLFPIFLSAQIEQDTFKARLFFDEGKEFYEDRAFEKAREPLIDAQQIYKQYQLWEQFHQTTILLHDSYLKKRVTEYVKSNIKEILATWKEPDLKPNFYKGKYYYQLGVAAMYENDSDQLLEHAKQALVLFEKSTDKSYLGDAYTLIGSYYWQIGDMEKAVQYREQSVRTGIELYGENSSETIKNYSYLAMFLSRTNDLDKGIAYAKKAEQIAYKVDPEKYLIHPYEAFAGLYYYKGDYQKSLDYFRKNLKIQLKNYGPIHQEIAEQSRGIAACLDMLGKYEEAVPFYQKNIEVHEALFGKFHRNITVSQRGIAYNYFKAGQYKDAAEYIQAALYTSLQLEMPDDVLINPPTDFLYEISDYENLIDLKNDILFNLYLKENDQKYLEAALNTNYFLDSYIDLLCQSFKGEQSKLLLLERARTHYYGAIHNCFELYHRTKDEKYLEQGFYFSEKSKAMLLLTSLRENLAKASNVIPDSLLVKQNSYKGEISQLKKTIYDLEQKEASRDSIDLLKNKLFKEENELDAFTDNLKEKYPDFFELKYNGKVAIVKEIQEHLPDDNTALVTYFFGGDWFPILKITKNSIQSDFKPFDKNIEVKIRSLIDLVNDNQLAESKGGDLETYQTFVNQSSSIYQFLFDDLIQPTDEKLIIIPDGVTAFLPFEILLNQPTDSTQINYASLPYLLKNHSIRQTYSATLLLEQENYKKNGQGILAFAPQYEPTKNNLLATRDGFTALKFTKEEAENIAEVTNGMALTGGNATEQLFKEKAGDSKILHLAMHAFSNDENPDYSGLIFTKTLDTLEDDVLHAYELYNMNLNAELAVLSACNTGSGKLAKGEGVMSLARAFRHAGCPNIVMSLWQADDEATSMIMQDFYKNLKNGKGKDEALRHAKLSYLESSPKTFPHYWSAFVLMGDGESVDFGNNNWIWMLGIGGVLFLGLIWFFRKNN